MDRLRQFKEMSTRRIVALAFAGAVLWTAFLFGLAAWLSPSNWRPAAGACPSG